MTGRDYLCGYNALSKQYFKVYFDIDRNLDGKIDDKDKEVRYDFHYGALVSNASFSCGNMFPYLIKDEGGVVIGERSSGGSCSVQKAALSEGFSFMISGYKFKLTDSRHSDLELGIEPDIPLAIPLVNGIDEITGEEGETKDYTAYGDLEQICGAMREWFR
jgi:C-terminal processing protease CtpA/Prc